jgi:hypothetical protein
VIFLLSMTVLAFKPKQIVIMTSLTAPRPLFSKKDWSIHKKLIQTFHKKENFLTLNNFTVKVYEGATQVELRKELLNPDNVGIFWVSHSSKNEELGHGVNARSSVVDINGNDVKKIFRHVHPNLRYLALIGCKAKPMIERFTGLKAYEFNSWLDIFSKDKEIDARAGMRRAVRAANVIFSNFKDQELQGVCPKKFGLPIKINRYIPEDADINKLHSVRIETREAVLGVFTKGKPGETQTITTYLPYVKEGKASDYKILANSGAPKSIGRHNIELGRFEIVSEWGGSWKLFADKYGNPLSFTHHIFIYKGPIKLRENSEVYFPFECR